MNDQGRQKTLDLLRRVASGDRAALDELLPLIYRELRSMADNHLRQRVGGLTLQPTQLVHETYLKILEGRTLEASTRAGFLALAAGAMRHVLIDEVRKKSAQKRGGGWHRITCTGLSEPNDPMNEIDLLALDDALRKMAELDERQARIVELKFFGGLSGQEIAEELSVSRNTVVRELGAARLWLARELAES